MRPAQNRRPLFWVILTFVLVILTAVGLSVWSSFLVVQNHRILEQLARVANDSRSTTAQLVVMTIIGILCLSVILLGLIYMFLRLIQSVKTNLAQTQFISAVTHELRSPVASLQILMETIRNPETPLEKRREFEEYMSADLKRLRGLVDQVLETARLEHFLKKAPTETIDVRGMLENSISHFKGLAATAGGKVQLEVPDVRTGLFMGVNPRLFRMAFESLLDNAMKYSPENPEIFVRVNPTDTTVKISVQDQGIGIPVREQKKVFARFYRSGAELTRERQGTGLGLYFAKLALSAQGGKISARSEGEGKGSTFEIEVPRR